MPVCNKQHLTTFEAQFIKKLSNTEAELKKSVAYEKKTCIPNIVEKMNAKE